MFTSRGRGNRFKRIEDAPAGFASKDFFVDIILEQLNDVRKNPHAAAFALVVAYLRHGRAGVALGNAGVKVQ